MSFAKEIIKELIMVEFDNDFKFNKNYISKSYINKKWLKNNGLSNFTIAEVKNEFNKCEKHYKKTGNKFNKSQQKVTQFVFTPELYKRLVKGFNHSNKQK